MWPKVTLSPSVRESTSSFNDSIMWGNSFFDVKSGNVFFRLHLVKKSTALARFQMTCLFSNGPTKVAILLTQYTFKAFFGKKSASY